MTPLLALALACTTTPPAPAPDAPTVAWTTIEGSKGAVEAIAARAAAAEGTPVLFVGATWCGSCKAYKQSLPDPRMVEAHAGVTILEVDAERHARTLDTLGITPAGVPHWEVLDRAGRPVGRHIDGSAWTLNTVGSMAPALSAFFQGG